MLMKQHEDFFQMVYEVVRLIPKGRVTNYGAIAKYLGAARSSRMVGWAMNAAHSQKKKVPAHRVVNRNGELTGKHHFETPFQMQELLEKEGVVIDNDKIKKFDNYFWDPMKELEL
jgi:methylated-DNA-protein-cysteine methyltransferase-like protein